MNKKGVVMSHLSQKSERKSEMVYDTEAYGFGTNWIQDKIHAHLS